MQDTSGRPDDALGRIEAWVSALTLGFAATLIGVAVVLRYVFAYSVSAFDELTRYAVILGTFVAASRLLHQNGHVTVDVLLVMLPERARLMLRTIAYICGAAFCLALIWYGWRMVELSMMMDSRSISNLRIPMWIPQSAVLLGALLLLVRFVQKVVRGVVAIRNCKETGSC